MIKWCHFQYTDYRQHFSPAMYSGEKMFSNVQSNVGFNNKGSQTLTMWACAAQS